MPWYTQSSNAPERHGAAGVGAGSTTGCSGTSRYENLIPLLVDCARAYATEGEIVDALCAVFGSYTEDPRF